MHTGERWKERARQKFREGERGGRQKWMKGRNFRAGGSWGGGRGEKNGCKEGKREEERVRKEKVREGNGGRRTEGGWGGGQRMRQEMVGQRLVQYLKKKRHTQQKDVKYDREGERERNEICPNLAFQDHQLIIHFSKINFSNSAGHNAH